jgi:beta-lactamase class D
LKYAFQHNIDWAFWELRKKIGNKKMNYWLKKMHYGNGAIPLNWIP